MGRFGTALAAAVLGMGATRTEPPPPDEPLVVDVWPGRPPEEGEPRGEEKVRLSPRLDRRQVEVPESTRLVTNVSRPTLTIFRPPREKDAGTAVLICPGGGYWDLYWQLEGEEVAA